jgi:hypothetical protein
MGIVSPCNGIHSTTDINKVYRFIAFLSSQKNDEPSVNYLAINEVHALLEAAIALNHILIERFSIY